MSGADDLRAARESRAGAAERANRSGLGDAMTRLVNAAVYRASHRSTPREPPPPPRSPTVRRGRPLGPGFRAAMRVADARIDALGLSELHTADGTVRYADTGEGTPVLLVHGMFGGTDAALRRLRPLVPDGFRVVAPSRFGYLGSSLPAGASPARQADAFAHLLDRLDIDSVAVLAVSAGAPAALELAIRHPDRVAALVLVSAHTPGQRHDWSSLPYAVARVLWGSERFMWLVRRHLPTRLARFMGVPAGRPLSATDRAMVDAELDGLFPVTRRVDGVLLDAFLSGSDADHHDVGRVTAPTLVVHARDDVLVPLRGATTLAQSIRGARLLVVEDGGHLMLGEHPEVATAVQALLRSTAD